MNDLLDTTSYWLKISDRKHYPSLEKDIETDTLIVGGGITGLNCAYCLGRKGVDTVLIEGDRLCSGGTGSSTGRAAIQQGVFYSRLISAHGRESASLYAKAQQETLAFLKDFASDESGAGFEECTSYLFAVSDKETRFLEDESEAARVLKIPSEKIRPGSFPPDACMLLGFPGQGTLQPVGYAEILAGKAARNGVRIFEHTRAAKVEGGQAINITCENGALIRAKHLIIATQYPFYRELSAFFTRLYAHRTYAIAAKTTSDWPDGIYQSAGEPFRSIRKFHSEEGPVMIASGFGHPTAREGGPREPVEDLIQFVTAAAGFSDLLAKWSAQDYRTPDGLPYIGRISKGSNIFAACGYGEWEITSGALAGGLLTELITEGKSEYEALLSPSRRPMGASAAIYFNEVAKQTKEYVRARMEAADSLLDMKKGEGHVILYNGRKAGAYMDDAGRLTIVENRCRHLGCELKWNRVERSWDCPCHGGRYSVDGRLLEGPAPGDLEILYKEND